MAFTEKQELYISRYIQEVGAHLENQLPPDQRERALARLRSRIEERLNAMDALSPVDDIEVLHALNKTGPTEAQASILARIYGENGESGLSPAKPSAPRYAAPAARPNLPGKELPSAKEAPMGSGKNISGAPVWLGVCRHLAQTWALPVWALRALALLLGIIGGPITLTAYMVLFFALYWKSGLKPPAPFRPFRCAWRPLVAGGFIAVFHCAGLYGIRAIHWAHQTYLERPVPDIREWGWLESEGESLLLGALAVLLPLALFSALPLTRGWDHTMKRLTQAGITLYAITISFGLASFITGILLQFVGEFTG